GVGKPVRAEHLPADALSVPSPAPTPPLERRIEDRRSGQGFWKPSPRGQSKPKPRPATSTEPAPAADPEGGTSPMPRRRRPALAFALALVYLVPAAAPARGGGLSSTEGKIVARVEANREEAVALLETVVNIPSGTQNVDGVRAVGRAFAAEFGRIGF